MSNFLAGLTLPNITQDHGSILEALICAAEISEAMQVLKLNKSPGPDDLTAEVYFFFKIKSHLLPHMQHLFIACIRDRKLPSPWSQAKLVLLPN